MRISVAVAVAVTLCTSSGAAVGSLAEVAPGAIAGTSCHTFPADNYWRADISDLSKHSRSNQWISNMSPGRTLHPDFGPNAFGTDYGIPVTVVPHDHRRVSVRFQYADESDRVRYPLGPDTRIEGGRSSDGDRHAIIVDRETCRLFETFDTRKRDGQWYAGSGATWSLRNNDLRPDGWTSADAAGLPILPGLLRWNEVRDRDVDHAIRFTTDLTRSRHVWPARHDASVLDAADYPPMGARFRLRPTYPTDGLSAGTRAVVRAMKHYGLVLADNGSPWFFQGEQNAHWPDRLIAELKGIPASAFVAVDTSGLKVSGDSARVR
jgi:hypothetical protein